MAGMNWERWARASGIGFVVMFIVSIIVFGTDSPKVNDSASEIASFFDGDSGRVLTGDVLFGVTFIIFFIFVAAIASTLREAGKGGWGALTIGAGATFVGVQAIVGAIAGALALNVAAAGDEGVITALNTLLSAADVISAFPLAAFILATSIGLSRTGTMPAWYGWLGFAAGVITFLHGTNWADSGFWSATGGWVFVTIIAALLWTLVTSGLLYMRTATAGAPERAAVPTS